jgi:hypothetical protein
MFCQQLVHHARQVLPEGIFKRFQVGVSVEKRAAAQLALELFDPLKFITRLAPLRCRQVCELNHHLLAALDAAPDFLLRS